MLVADSCGDDNAWCRDSHDHLDLATAAVTNLFTINGQPISYLPGNFNNRKISWSYIDAPNYTGDIKIYFMQGAEKYWPAIAINNLKNGIHGVDQLVNGVWVPVAMNSDMGQAYILQGGVSRFQIRVYDVNDQLINGARVYTFDFPSTSCGGKCTAPVTEVIYTIQ
jgi:expansin (peptidoglycan-binding protein)